VLVLVTVVGAAWATEGGVAEQAARGHFLAGKAYYASGEYKRALGEFLAARTDDDRPELDYNIGLSYEQLGDAARAVAAYDRFTARQPIVDVAEASELARRVGALRAHIGHIVIASLVPTSILTLDGSRLEPLQRGALLPVTAGPHEVTASADGMFERTKRVVVAAGDTTRVEIDPMSRARSRLAPWAVALISVGSVVVAGAVVTGAVLGARANGSVTPGNTSPGVVTVRP
jgi:hypothetical protein